MSPTPVPPIHGTGNFGVAPGQQGPALISQLNDGSLDLLAYNKSGQFISSDLVPGTAGAAPVVGAGDTGVPLQHSASPNTQGGGSLFGNGVTSGPVDDIITQDASGQLVVYGFSGNFGSLTLAGSAAVPNTVGYPHIGDVDPAGANAGSTFALYTDPGFPKLGYFVTSGSEVELIGQLPNGQIDGVFLYATSTTPTVALTNLENLSLPGWDVVPGGQVGTEIFHDYFFTVIL